MTTGNWRGIFNILQTPFSETGDLLWRFGTEGPIVSSPAAEDGLIFIGSTDHRLYALKA